ncbi:MAG: hypothetical protein ACXV5J_03470 [Candidatus Angelobacter sp.]
MEPTIPANRDFLESRFYNGITILLAVVVTIAVCMTIAGQWKTYEWIKKLLAIALLLNLATVPLAMIIKLSKGKKTKPDMLVQTAYIWLMLATMLFTR